MTVTSHFTVPENLAAHTAVELHSLICRLEEWFTQHDTKAQAHALIDNRGSSIPTLIVSREAGTSMQVEPGDTLIACPEADTADQQLRFATMEEEAELHQAERTAQPTLDSTEYELTWQNLNGTIGQAIITADHIASDDQYLMFMLGGKIVHATRHSAVIEFNQPEVQRDNVRDADGEQVPLQQAGVGNKFLP